MNIARASSRLRPSRKAVLAGVAILGASLFFFAIVGVAALVMARGGPLAVLLMFALPLMSAVAAATILPSRRTSAYIKAMAARHLFAHRYDYRLEWHRFADTVGGADDSVETLDVRIVKAIADITDAASGLLLLPEDGRLSPRASWNWTTPTATAEPALSSLLADGRIVDIDAMRNSDIAAGLLPEWITANPAAWAIVPIIHFEALAGAVVLERPSIERALDWEDFDLLRVAGRQAASYLAEARGQDRLAELQRFDEFNRRFAFIMHDIKNLVSQLTLITRNAERHADNPEFRVDMIATLKTSTGKMSDLLARLSQQRVAPSEVVAAIDVGRVVETVAAAKRSQHPVVVSGDMHLPIVADASRLETAFGHLLQNAIEASPPNEPVIVAVRPETDTIAIEIRDFGCGMDADFVRSQLFRPFASTKEAGFGIGAYEARTLIVAMGGTLSVISDEGVGSSFTIRLPAGANWQGAAAA